MTDLILIRHGETAWNRDKRFQGQLDIPLNALGHEQAQRVAARLGQEPHLHLVSSDLIRAQETARPLAQALQLGVVLAADLREQNYGVLEGLTLAEFALKEPDVLANWRAFKADFQIPGGESTRHFYERVCGVMQRLATAYPAQTLVVVTHGGVLDMIYRHAKSQSLDGPRQVEIPNCGINRVRVDASGGALRLEVQTWADVAHLQGMAYPPRTDPARPATGVGAASTLPA